MTSKKNEEYHIFVMCRECLEVLGPLMEEGDWSWTVYANKHKEGKHRAFENIKIPTYMINQNIMDYYPDHWKEYYKIPMRIKK